MSTDRADRARLVSASRQAAPTAGRHSTEQGEDHRGGRRPLDAVVIFGGGGPEGYSTGIFEPAQILSGAPGFAILISSIVGAGGRLECVCPCCC